MCSFPACRQRFANLLTSVVLVLGSAITSEAQTVPSGFNDALVLGGFNQPVGFVFDANGRMYVWERVGKVWIVENGVKLATPLIDISEEVGNWGDFGLLGFALDPDFVNNGRLYLSYVVDRYYLLNFGQPGYDQYASTPNSATIMRITRYTANAPMHNTADPASRFVLFGESMTTAAAVTHGSHGNGTLLFGRDGTLLASLGDGASYNLLDVGNSSDSYFTQCLADGSLTPATNVGALRSQMIDCANGKVLRLDPNTGDGIASNPWYDGAHPRAPRSRVWALGLRNPYRMTLRPGTGSTVASDGQPGTLYIGEVGFQTWEELDVCREGGLNFGWPLFEGLTPQDAYTAALTQNLNAPNPLFGQGACTEPYFNFQDLCKQETPVEVNGHPNPCDNSQQVPQSIPTFYQQRPVIDWKHANESRCGGFTGNTPVTYDLDLPGSPVPGPRFGGFASVGGAWLTGSGWPAGYQNCYYHADYGGGWIKRFRFDDQDHPQQVYDFGASMGAVVCMREGPDGGLWYIRYDTGEVRRIRPTGSTNLPPTAHASQNTQYGPGPLNVSFNATGSTDPEGGLLSYAWNFGDGFLGSGVSTSHTFTALPNTPTSYTVMLTVTDDQNQSTATTLLVSVNNTPPVVFITSFANNDRYPVGTDTTFALQAAVGDAQSPASSLVSTWQTILHHNTHVHPGPLVVAPSTTSTISGEGCYLGESYSYEVKLTVVDPQGLSTTVSNMLLPRCSAIAPTSVITSDVSFGEGPFTTTLSGVSSSDNGTIVSYAWDLGDGTTASGATISKTFSEVGDYNVRLTVTDNDGNTGTSVKVINVLSFDPPQCVGSAGSIMREVWNNIGGTNVVDLTSSSFYPNSPSATTFPTSFAGPVNDGDNYGARFRGYIIAPENGVYHFTVTSDASSILYLSYNADPKYKRSICNVPTFTGQNEYTKFASQRSADITLRQGVYYYVELLQKESTGTDHASVFWERPSVPAITLIGGAQLARWQNCGPSVTLRAELQGAYSVVDHEMRDDLRQASLIPSLEPFTALGFTQVGGGGETVSPALLAVSGKNAIVDWVLVELRNKNTPSTIVATRSALIQRDGDVIGTDGRTRMLFPVAGDNYYIALRHRNHLGLMTFASRTLGPNEQGIDLTLGATATYGTDARAGLGDGRWGLWCGNVNHNNRLLYTGAGNDRDPILIAVGGTLPTHTVTGYSGADVTLNGVVQYTGAGNDRDPILVNIGGLNPNASRFEQLP